VEQREVDTLCQWKKQQMVKLMEISDLTNQLAQAVERNDQVSVRMVLSMRQDPVKQAQELDERIQAYVLTLPEETAIRMNALLRGEKAKSPEEEALESQVARNRRLLEKITQLDRLLSLRLGGSKSFYRKFRDEA